MNITEEKINEEMIIYGMLHIRLKILWIYKNLQKNLNPILFSKHSNS